MKKKCFIGLLIFYWMIVGLALGEQPGAITGLHSTTHTVNNPSNDKNIGFSWEPVENAVGYSYVIDTSNSTLPDGETEILDPNATSVTVTVPSDGDYYFHIRAVGSLGELGPVSHIGPFRIDTTPPGRVINFTATPGNAQVALNFTAPVDGDVSKVIVRYQEAGLNGCEYPSSTAAGILVQEFEVSPGEEEYYLHTGLTNGTTYCYSAFACDKTGNCGLREIANATLSSQESSEETTNNNGEGGSSNSGTISGGSSGTTTSSSGASSTQEEVEEESIPVDTETTPVFENGQVTLEDLQNILGPDVETLESEDLAQFFNKGAQEIELGNLEIRGEIEIPDGKKLIGGSFNGEINLGTNAKIERARIQGRVKGIDISLDVDVENLINNLPEIKESTLVPDENNKIYLKGVLLKGVDFEIQNREELELGVGVVFDRTSLANLAEMVGEIDITNVLPSIAPYSQVVKVNFQPPAPDFPLLVADSGEEISPAKIVGEIVKDKTGLEVNSDVTKDIGIINLDLEGLEVHAMVGNIMVAGEGTSFAAVNNTEIKILSDGCWWVKEEELGIKLIPSLHNLEEFEQYIKEIEPALPGLEVTIDQEGLLHVKYQEGTEEKHLVMVPSGIAQQAEEVEPHIYAKSDESGNVVMVYPDGKQEKLAPAPIGLISIGKYLSSLGIDWQFDRTIGILSVKIDGQNYRFRPDYQYKTLSPIEREEVENTEEHIKFESDGNCLQIITTEGKQRFCPITEE